MRRPIHTGRLLSMEWATSGRSISIVETHIFEYHFEERGTNIMTKEMLLEIGDKHEAEIAANKQADARYR